MQSSETIIESLKSHLKMRGLSYQDVAEVWGVAHSSVKRIMSSKEISLLRIEMACQLMDLAPADFYRQIPFEKTADLFYLSKEQELKLSKDPEALHYFLLLQHGEGAGEISKKYSITQEKSIRIQAQLERMGLIEVHPQDRIKRNHIGRLRFRKDGPIGRHLEKVAKTQFLETEFQKDDEYFTFLNLYLIPGDPQKLKVRFIDIFKKLVSESDENRKHPNAINYGIIMAMRSWPAPLMNALPPRKTRK